MSMPDDLIDFLCGGELDPDYPIRQKQRELKDDYRKNKARMIDINAEYSEFKAFASTPEYKHTQIATELLSRHFDVSDTALKSTLQSNYGLSDGQCHTVLKNLANSKNVEFNLNVYTNTVKLRRK